MNTTSLHKIHNIHNKQAPQQTHQARTLALRPVRLAAAMLCGSWMAAYAQQPAPTSQHPAAEHQLHSVEVSATGLGLGESDMAAPVTVLDGQLWQQTRAATLGDSLTSEPGMHATHFGAGASRPIIRGMDGPRVGVLANGTPLHDASTISPDHAVVTEPMLIQQVEILRGPAALVHGGAVGGVVNVVDQKIPTARPDKAYEGEAELRWSSAAHEKTGALGLTAGTGPLVLRVEAAGRNAGNYRTGSTWHVDGQRQRKVPNSLSEGNTGSIGLSWVGDQSYVGAAYTRQRAQYGLPGHEHQDCHLHGQASIHCGHHVPHHAYEHDHGHAHTHENEGAHGPEVDMVSHRWDLRGEWRNPIEGVEAVRINGSHTRYGHDEVEEGVVATAFRNRAHDLQLSVQHAPVAGWRGVVGLSNGQRSFSAEGEEGYVPATHTQKQGLFIFEEHQWKNWRLQAALRHDRQSVQRLQDAQERRHSGTSASLGTVWKFAPGLQASASFSRAVRLPSAEELYANGMHVATSSWEIGNSELKKETSNAWDFGVRKLIGSTTWSVNFYHYRINGYIYGRTVHEDQGVQLQHYTQADARFTGVEGQVRQRINRFAGVTLFGDVVRAKLAHGGHLPRIPAARVGLRVDGSWQGWEAMAEWVQVAKQNRAAAFETASAGYGMLNLGASYRFASSPLQLTIKAENLTDRLAYVHTSAIKHAAPLKGRNITVGLRAEF